MPIDTGSAELLAAVKYIAALKTWNECAQAVPQVRQSKADISNTLDVAISIARVALASRAA